MFSNLFPHKSHGLLRGLLIIMILAAFALGTTMCSSDSDTEEEPVEEPSGFTIRF